jgi:hypothetical protein
MRSTESIVKEYRKADLEKRLYLFLECPALRATFTEIDQSENATASAFPAATRLEFVDKFCCRELQSTPDVRRIACCDRG